MSGSLSSPIVGTDQQDTKYRKEDDDFIYTCLGPVINEEKNRVYFNQVEVQRKHNRSKKGNGGSSVKKAKKSNHDDGTDLDRPTQQQQQEGDVTVYKKGQKIHLHAPEGTVYVAEIYSIYALKHRPGSLHFEAKWFYAPKDAQQLKLISSESASKETDKKKNTTLSSSSGTVSSSHDAMISIDSIHFHPNEMLDSNHRDDNDIAMIKCPANVLFLPSNYDLPPLWPSDSSRDQKSANEVGLSEKSLILCRYRLDMIGINRASVSIVPLDHIQQEFQKYYTALPLIYRQSLEKQRKWWRGLQDYGLQPTSEFETTNDLAGVDQPKLKLVRSNRKSRTIHNEQDKTTNIANTPSLKEENETVPTRLAPEDELALSLGLSIEGNKELSQTKKPRRKQHRRSGGIKDMSQQDDTNTDFFDLTSEHPDTIQYQVVNATEVVQAVSDIRSAPIQEGNQETNHEFELISSNYFDGEENHNNNTVTTMEDSYHQQKSDDHNQQKTSTITELEMCDPLVNLGHDHNEMYLEHMDSVEVTNMLLSQGTAPTTMLDFTSFPEPPSISPVPPTGAFPSQHQYCSLEHQYVETVASTKGIEMHSAAAITTSGSSSSSSNDKTTSNRKNWYDVVTVPRGEEHKLLQLLDFSKKTEDLSFLLWYRQERVLPSGNQRNKNEGKDTTVTEYADVHGNYSEMDQNLLTEKDFKFWKNHLTYDKLIPYHKIINQLRKEYRGSGKYSGSGETGTTMTLLPGGLAGRKRSRSLGDASATSTTGTKMLNSMAVAATSRSQTPLKTTVSSSAGATGSGSSGKKKVTKKTRYQSSDDENGTDEDYEEKGDDLSDNDDQYDYFGSMTNNDDAVAPSSSISENTRLTRRSLALAMQPPVPQPVPVETFTARERECIKNSAIIPELRSEQELIQSKAFLIPTVPCYQLNPERDHEVNLELYFTLAMKEVNRLKRELLLSMLHPEHYAILSYDEALLISQHRDSSDTIDMSMFNYFGDTEPCLLKVDGSMVVAKGDLLHIFLQVLHKNDCNMFAAIGSLQNSILFGLSVWSLDEMQILHKNYHRFGVHIHKFKQLLPKKTVKDILEYLARFLHSSYKFDVLINNTENHSKTKKNCEPTVAVAEDNTNGEPTAGHGKDGFEESNNQDSNNSPNHNSSLVDTVCSVSLSSSVVMQLPEMVTGDITAKTTSSSQEASEQADVDSVVLSSPEYLSEEEEPERFDEMFDEDDFQVDPFLDDSDVCGGSSSSNEQQAVRERVESVIARFAAQFDEYSYHQMMSIFVAWEKLFLTPAELAIRIVHLVYEATFVGTPLTLQPSTDTSQSHCAELSPNEMVANGMTKDMLYREWLKYRQEALKAKRSILNDLRALFPEPMVEKVFIIPDESFFGSL